MTPTTSSRAARSARSASRSPTRATCTRCFDGIPLDEMNTSMTINATAAWLLGLYVTVADENGVERAALKGTTQNDIIKEYLSRGTYAFPPGPSMRLIADTVAFSRQRDPELEPHQRLLLPPAGGRGDAGAGDRLRPVHRDRRPRRGQGPRPGGRGRLPQGLRPDLVLRQRRRPVRRGAREAAGDGRDVGVDRARTATASPTRSSCGCATASRSTAWASPRRSRRTTSSGSCSRPSR